MQLPPCGVLREGRRASPQELRDGLGSVLEQLYGGLFLAFWRRILGEDSVGYVMPSHSAYPCGGIAARSETCSQPGPGRIPSRCGNASKPAADSESSAINSASAQLSLRPR